MIDIASRVRFLGKAVPNPWDASKKRNRKSTAWLVSHRRIRGSYTKEPRAKWHLNVSMDPPVNIKLHDTNRMVWMLRMLRLKILSDPLFKSLNALVGMQSKVLAADRLRFQVWFSLCINLKIRF
jgi:hypothetical protein